MLSRLEKEKLFVEYSGIREAWESSDSIEIEELEQDYYDRLDSMNLVDEFFNWCITGHIEGVY